MPRIGQHRNERVGQCVPPQNLRSPAPLRARRADVVLMQGVDQGAAQDAREYRGLRHRERDRRQRQGAHAGQNPALQPGNPPAEVRVQADREHQHEQHAQPEIRHRQSQLRECGQRRIARRGRAAPRPRGPSARRRRRQQQCVQRERQRYLQAFGDQCRDRERGRCSSNRNRRAAGRPPIRDSAAAAAHPTQMVAHRGHRPGSACNPIM
jgi:hypothetical protein